ncbi:TIGR02588 family protein [Merismopedia glauca]|uniref:TIGR02588 family protein n=1 Tax=Merismopedia glauca CCAP 1448/3 TaxID=1296344 RepID=A0A2T1BY50_9CYAN|nr:TIGR02588 family protein [Merismopedia glauca]PSB00931.1 TIGR02588 family protein [Merismopedia glauca CCAP 1448/3]
MKEISNPWQNEDELDSGKRTPAEWISLGFATLILTGIVGLISYNWLTKSSESVIINIQVQAPIKEIKGKFYVPFKIDNQGGKTVELVQAIAELKINDKVEETGEQVIDFLSSNEEVEGAFIFENNPQKGELKLKISSYKLP